MKMHHKILGIQFAMGCATKCLICQMFFLWSDSQIPAIVEMLIFLYIEVIQDAPQNIEHFA